MKIRNKNFILILCIALLFASCRNASEFDRAIGTFMVFTLQIISFVLFGVSAMVLSIVSSSSKTNTARTIAIVLLSIFALFSLINFSKINDINPNENYIYYSFFIDVIIIAISIYFLTKSKSSKFDNEDVTDDYLDKIIDSELEDEI